MRKHLLDRHLDPDRYPSSVIVNDDCAEFLLWDCSGRLLGHQCYNPKYEKLHSPENPHEAKYFTKCFSPALWGLEFPLSARPILFVQEGVFDACRIHSLGYPAVAVLGSNPKPHLNFLNSLPHLKVSLLDGDIPVGDRPPPGDGLIPFVDLFMRCPPGLDVGKMDEMYLYTMIKYMLKGFEYGT